MYNDAYAFTHLEPYAYFHGGYNEFYPTGNFIARMNLQQEPYTTEFISPNYDMPAGRNYHTITSVGRYLYMYGGNDGKRALDELWRFDSDKEIWEYATIFGAHPTPR